MLSRTAPLLIIALLTLTFPAQAQDACGASSVETGEFTRTIEAGDMERSYTLYIPDVYDASVQVPLVLSLHGFLSNAGQQATWSEWSALADTENFIAVYPQGAGRPTRWNAGNASFIGGYDVDDVGFIRQLIEQVSDEHCIDPERVFVTGLSNGGGMTNRLACEMADTIAAVGTVAGAYTSFDDGCDPARPIPVIAFHGTADRIVSFEGTNQFPAIRDWAAEWADRNGCEPQAVSIPVNTTVTAEGYPSCDADVILYVIEGGDHVWPGDSPLTVAVNLESTEIHATETMWAFFKARPLNQ